MDEESLSFNEQVEANLAHRSKRLKTSHHDSLPSQGYDKYTIGWICALHIELAAAQIMLDEVHDRLPRRAGDNNTYVLGKIKQHYVVIATLPEAEYGTNNAAKAMTNMTRTFPAVRAGLMVGIGGGVPGKVDMHLGDVVVGTRVMQCDLGKIVTDGQLQRTAVPRIPHQLLGTAVSTLRSKHEHRPSQISSILQHRIGEQSNYSRPNLPDYLFEATYYHDSSTSDNCDRCDHSRLVRESERMSDDIKIHYGAIASGNQVMRDGQERDIISRQLGVICFEMESAGLIDILPCLTIRGICDYSDSHKSKGWQKYAAAVAAAYAREFLEVLPVAEPHAKVAYMPNHYQGSVHEHRERLLEALKFEQMDSRKTTIRTAHTRTCRWFLDHHDYKTWLDLTKLAQHHGFLWLSGKPGAGKSTMMKFAYSSMRKNTRYKHSVASFFFNARGGDLEKSISGMYRSLLLQLLQGYPDLQIVLDDTDLIPPNQNDFPCLNVLKELFRNAVLTLGERTFTCFVDALDECDEQQAVDMVQYFDDLTEKSSAKCIPFRICFSSRHYPYIVIQQGISLTLEDQCGHYKDMETYVAGRLRVQGQALAKQLQSEILRKAAGVFIWVVLVVDILNKEYRRGGMFLKRRLAEIPSDLSELFKDILKRDEENMEALKLCIMWILYAKQPLQPEEFYYALQSYLSLDDLFGHQVLDDTVPDTSVVLDPFHRYVISSSKGLAEVTKGKDPTVQFFHESVKDFLIEDKGLYELWPDLRFDCESKCHEKLKQCCNLYMNHTLVSASVTRLLSAPDSNGDREITNQFSFLEYANQHILYHADVAAKRFPQDAFLSSFPLSYWIKIHNRFKKSKSRKYSPDASIFYILADNGLSDLILTRLKEDSRINVQGERYRYPIFAALANGHKDAAAALLGLPSYIYNGVDIAEGLGHQKDLKNYKGRTPLSWAAQEGRTDIFKLLLQPNLVNELDRRGRTPLHLASKHGHEAVTQLLIDKGANVDVADQYQQTPLHLASGNGHEAVAQLPINKVANVSVLISKSGQTPLHLASENGHEAVVRLLIDKGANLDVGDKYQQTPLHLALEKGHEAVAGLLIDKGANVDVGDEYQHTLLHLASKNGWQKAVARLLIDKGANVDVGNPYQQTPLHLASENGHEPVARLLIDNGAIVDVGDTLGKTPLFLSLQKDHETVARLLIEKGANVGVNDTFGSVPLHYASKNGHEAVARILIEKGANLDVGDTFGSVPLHYASKNGHEAVARILIEKGANLDVGDTLGQTPLRYALKYGHETVAQLLINKGANTNIRGEDGYC